MAHKWHTLFIFVILWFKIRILIYERKYKQKLRFINFNCSLITINIFNDLEVFNFELINTNKNVSKANKKTLKDGVLSKNSIKTLKLDDWIEDFSLIYKEFKKAKEDQIDNDINLDLGKYSSRESPNF